MPKLLHLSLAILVVTSSVALQQAHASLLPDGADCNTNDECTNARCASVTKKCCKLDWNDEPCESDFCKGSAGLKYTEGHGACDDAWYTDYINSGVSIDAIEVVSSLYVETPTVPDAIFTMTALTSLTLVGTGAVNGLSGLTNLKTLYIPYPSGFSGGEVQPLSPALTSLSSLETLLYTPNSDDEQTYSIVLAEAWANSLKDLDLSSGTMAEFVMKLSKLTYLHITDILDTGSWPSTFGSELDGLQHLYLATASNLDLPSNVFFGNTALEYLFLGQLSSTLPLPSSIWELGTLTSLWFKYLKAPNGLPASISSLSNLQAFSLFDLSALTGSLPDDLVSLSDLSYLEIWDIPNISGSLPDDIGNLTAMESLLFTKLDSFIGSIPMSISDMTNLKYLMLTDLKITGTLPELSGLDMLTSLTLEETMLESLEGMNNLPSLRSAKIKNNEALTHPLPNFNFPALTSLEFWGHSNYEGEINIDSWNLPLVKRLELRANWKTPITGLPSLQGKGELSNLLLASRFGGTLPSEWGANVPKLTTIDLSYFPLSGTIPSEFAELSDLQDLKLTECGLTGSFPSELGGLPHLVSLELADNSLVGSLPDFVKVTDKHNKKYFYLSGNSFTGSLPGNHDLGVFKGDNNSFSGTFPSEFFTFNKDIEQLSLTNNSLAGTLPSIDSTGAVIELNNLERLWMRGNSLSGTLPSWATNHMLVLKIDDNKFSGTIPSPSSEFKTGGLFLDGGNRWVGGIPKNMTVWFPDDPFASDVLQNQTWPFIASGEPCSTGSSLCTAGSYMCGRNGNKQNFCCARIDANGSSCPTGNCAPSSSPIPGECIYTATPTTTSPSTLQLSFQPTSQPSFQPSSQPTETPTQTPTKNPTTAPTKTPTSLVPTESPTLSPTVAPTQTRVIVTASIPTASPAAAPTEQGGSNTASLSWLAAVVVFFLAFCM